MATNYLNRTICLSAHVCLTNMAFATVWNYEICGHLIEDFCINPYCRIKISSGCCYWPIF